MMKRPPGLWVLLSAGVLWLSMQDVYGIRATSLIFGKTTTSTTTTEQSAASEEEVATTEVPAEGNSTKPVLTGNPQIDYIWDPNLPKELNGYNLSDYPFYERVPEDIDFKCDGLHDGFYASVKHKCQVYHHCLFGTRYDFLCANYTAFDQKTFICHFASEVDCANSKRFWHRNDALYIAATTTTIKPFVIYTTPPKPDPITAIPAREIGSQPPAAPRRRRPFRRRRPQFYYEEDYYDDYYDERPRPNRGRKRPRPRPRPLYEDEYEEYEDEVYERKGGSRRRPYNRGSSGRRRNKDKVDLDYDDEDYGFDEEDYRLSSRRKSNYRKKLADDKDYPSSRQHGKRRPQSNRENYEKRTRTPASDEFEEDYDSYERPNKKQGKTKPEDETRALIKPVSGTIYDRPRVAPKIKPPVPKNEADKYAYKPITPTTSISKEPDDYYDYDEEPKPRDHRRPTNRNMGGHKSNEEPEPTKRNKYHTTRPRSYGDHTENRKPAQRNEQPKTSSYRTSTSTKAPEASTESYDNSQDKLEEDEEYYDEYEDEEITTSTKKPTTSTTTPTSTTTTTTTQAPIGKIEQPLIRLVKRPFLPSRGGNPFSSRGLQPVGARALNKDETEQDNDRLKDSSKANEDVQEQTTQPAVFKSSPDVLKMSDPVFTSGGGAQEDSRPQPDPRLTYKNKELPNSRPTTPPTSPERNIFASGEFQPVPDPRTIFKIKQLPNSPQKVPESTFTSEGGAQEPFRPQLDPRMTYKNKATSPAKVPEKNPLDINEDDYDVTLNDALNPTLPNLPVRGYNIANEYSYSNFRPQYNSDQAVAPAMAKYAYQIDSQNQRYEMIPRSGNRGHVVGTNNDYKGQYSVIRENYRPRQAQQTQAFYSRY